MAVGRDSRDAEAPATGAQAAWAPLSWFRAQATEDAADDVHYFGHEHNAYQLYRHGRLVDILADNSNGMGREALLDVGCATGVLTDRVRSHFGFDRARGVDFLPEVLKRGRELYPKVEFGTAVLPRLQESNISYDLVIASEVLYYLTLPGRIAAVDEISRVLKPNGILLFTAALGGPYFSLAAARELLERRFELVDERHFHMGWYHRLMAPFFMADRLHRMLHSGREPASEEMRNKYLRLRPLLAAPPVRIALGLLAQIGRPILRMRWPIWLFDRVLRAGRPTNIVLVCRRR